MIPHAFLAFANYRNGRLLFAGLAACIYAIHAWNQTVQHHSVNMLWFCNVALLMIVYGFVFKSPNAMGIGFVWSVFGLPIWAYELITVGGILWSSFMTHFGSILLSGIGMLTMGAPKGLWWKAVAAFLPLHIISRLFTPPDLNINLAHEIRLPPSLEAMAPPYLVYMAAFYIAGAVFALLVEVSAGPVRNFLTADKLKPSSEADLPQA